MSHHDERTFAMVKPDGVQRGLIGEIVSRFEDRGLKLVAGKFIQIDEELAHEHYGDHEDKPFFDGLVEFITSGPVFAMVWEGADATRIRPGHDPRRLRLRPRPQCDPRVGPRRRGRKRTRDRPLFRRERTRRLRPRHRGVGVRGRVVLTDASLRLSPV